MRRIFCLQCDTINIIVSVPLPGFSGLRHQKREFYLRNRSFSPVAGIQWVETLIESEVKEILESFSPVAGIQWVETLFTNSGCEGD